jgi:hypothetical protein
MSDSALTVSNPQQIKVEAVVSIPGQGMQTKLLDPGEQWEISGGVTPRQWVAFFGVELGDLLAAALLPDNSSIAQLLLDVGVEGILRINPQEPLTVANGLSSEVTVQLQNVGAAAPQTKTLTPRGQQGSSASFSYAERGQWLGFYDSSGTYVTGTWAGSYSEVTLVSPRQSFVVGTPYPVSSPAVQEGAVRLTSPAVE